ncbi:MFS transporter, partial [Pseudomonas sp. MPR-R5A]
MLSREKVAMKSHPDWLQSYIDSPEKQQKLYRQTLLIVVISQIFG